MWDRDTAVQAETVHVQSRSVAWSPEGDRLAIALDSTPQPGAIMIVDRSGTSVDAISEDPGFGILDLAFMPDGQHLAAVRELIQWRDPTVDGVRVWDLSRGEPVLDLPVNAHRVAVDSTGTRIAVAEVGLAGSVWDVETGSRLATLTGHTGSLTDVAFSPDGTMIATAAVDDTVRLWAADSGVEVLTLRGHDGPVWSVDFGPDGNRLISAGEGLARVWTLDLDELIDIAERRLTRSLTDAECHQYLHVEACPA
jgi:WD40 repeat protein